MKRKETTSTAEGQSEEVMKGLESMSNADVSRRASVGLSRSEQSKLLKRLRGAVTQTKDEFASTLRMALFCGDEAWDMPIDIMVVGHSLGGLYARNTIGWLYLAVRVR